MSTSVFLAQNVFNARAFPGHQLTASEEADGREVWRVATGRRVKDSNFWTPTSANTEAWVQVQMDQSRTVDMIALDRDHNLDGDPIVLEKSPDGTAWTQVFSLAVPSSASADSALGASPGAVTERDGAWLYRFGDQTDQYFRLRIPAMGAGIKPEIVGLYLGKSIEMWSPADLPFGWGDHALSGAESRSGGGVVGRSRLVEGLRRTVSYRTQNAADYDIARDHFDDHFRVGRPMWVVLDDTMAERAWLAIAPLGTQGDQQDRSWSSQRVRLVLEELSPRPIHRR